MARYCVAFKSMQRFLSLTGGEELEQLVGVVSQCQEFSDVHLRVTEKRVLNTLNKDKNRITVRSYTHNTHAHTHTHKLYRFPMDGKIKSKDMKVNWSVVPTTTVPTTCLNSLHYTVSCRLLWDVCQCRSSLSIRTLRKYSALPHDSPNVSPHTLFLSLCVCVFGWRVCVWWVGGGGGSFSSSFIASMLYIRFSCRSAGAKDAGWRVQSSVELCSPPQVYPGQVPIHHNVDSHTHTHILDCGRTLNMWQDSWKKSVSLQNKNLSLS